jgi:ubiquinone/menaquinone biosynthesis C-methylase UbiE
MRDEHYWSKVASAYDDRSNYVVGRRLRERVREELARVAPKGETLELGCGTGFFTRALATQATRLTATDLSEEMLEVARAQLSPLANLSFLRVDCCKTLLPDSAYDGILIANVLNALREPELAVRESARMLRPGGKLLVINYTYFGLNPWRKLAYVFRFLRSYGIPDHATRAFTPDGLRKLVEDEGRFRVEAVQILSEETPAVLLVAERTRGGG